MQKRGKPSLFLSVILPIILVEILFIVVTVLSIIYGYYSGTTTEDTQTTFIVIILASGIFFLLAFIASILIYVLRYSSYEKSLYPEGNLNPPCLVGFIMAAASYLFAGFMGLIPFIGTFFAFLFGVVIIAGGVVSFVGIATIKKGEKGKGLANIGGFLGIYYLVHLIAIIILVISLFAIAYSTISSV